MSSSAFTPTVLTISGTGGSGNGEKNYITNPSMASATTGWNVIGDFTLSRSTSSSELPREYTTATGIKIVANTNPQSAADYVYFDFNLDDVDLNRKLKIQWSQKKIGTFAGTNMAVVITSQSDRTTALYTPVTTAIPAIDGDFQTSFDSASTAALSLVIRGTSTDMTTGDGICISDVIVGPGEIVQGAAISEWQTFTVVANNISSSGTNALSYGRYRRIGSSIELNIVYRCGSTGGSSSGSQISFNMPDNLLIDTNVAQGVGGGAIPNGIATWYDASAAIYKTLFATWGSTSTVVFNVSGTGGSLLGTDIGSNQDDRISFSILLPVSQYSGSGTVNLGPGAQQEFASVGGTWDADSSTTVYGPSGSTMGGALTATRDKTITWQYPPQSDDILTLEFKFASTDGGWVPLADVWPNDNSNVGAYILQTDSTGKTVVRFRRYRTGTSDWLNTYQWRVRKAKASSPVGFGKADSTSFGLVGPRRGQQSLTVTSTIAGWATTRAVGVYYQDQDGNHRLKFNMRGQITSTSSAIAGYVTMSGVTVKSTTSFFQAFNVSTNGSAVAPVTQAITDPSNPSSNHLVLGIQAGTSVSGISISGDIELDSKPTWS